MTVTTGKRKAKLSKADAVESRRVQRTAEHDAAADPFAATRAKMGGGILDQAAAVQDGAK